MNDACQKSKTSFWKHLIDLRVSHVSLSVARFCFFVVCFLEYLQLYLNRRISFSFEPTLTSEVVLPITMILLILMALGYQTRVCAFLTFGFIWYTQRQLIDHYHFDHAMNSLAFVFLFAPRPQALSLDSYFRSNREHPASLVPGWFVLLIFLAIYLVYFDSLFYKYTNVIWLNGYAFWLPSALPHFSTGLFPVWADIPWLVKGLSYLSLCLETVMPLILVRRLRVPIFLVGFGLHAGILFFFPIPLFGAGFCALYLIFLDWGKIFNRLFGLKLPVLAAIPPLRYSLVQRFGFALPAIMLLSQLLLIYANLMPRNNPLRSEIGNIIGWPNRIMGIARHPVYSDSHFVRRSPLFRFIAVVDGKDVEIPTFTENSYPRYPETTGRYFVMHLFYMRSDYAPLERLEGTWSRFLKGWFLQKELPLDQVSEVKVLYHQFDLRLELNFDYRRQIADGKWQRAGTLRFDERGTMISAYDEGFIEVMERTRRGIRR